MLSSLLDLVFPRQCPVCRSYLRAEEPQICLACSIHVAPFTPELDQLDEVRALGAHEDELQRAVHALKYGGEHWRGRVLGRWMATVPDLAALAVSDSMVLPVPLSRLRLMQRGFDQAAELATGFARQLRLPLRHAKLVRVRNARSQASRARDDRGYADNPFRVRGQIACPVILVDDVVTTGATLTACATALRQAGAPQVHAVTLTAGGQDARARA